MGHILVYIYTSVDLCIYIHGLKWNRRSGRVVGPGQGQTVGFAAFVGLDGARRVDLVVV